LKILLTGATGFIGGRVLADLLEQGMDVRAAVRRSVELPCESINVGSISGSTDWQPALSGVSVVVHIAGLYYHSVLSERRVSGEKLRQVNVEGTRRLAAQSVLAGVRHFVLLSSIGAACEDSMALVTAETSCCPVSAYGKSKLLGEFALREEARRGDMQTTVLRPPLVYGPGGSGNMARMVRLANMGIPLPFASLRNRRSFVYVGNLVDLIATCLGNPKAFGKTFFPSDGEDVSTPELIRAIARANESVQCSVFSDSVPNKSTRHPSPATRHSPRLFPFPESALKVMGRVPGLGALRKLTSSLYVDSEPLRRDLGWTPPFTMEQGLRRTLAS
jgi:nucleoside-diphosphate-sugar epimerase